MYGIGSQPRFLDHVQGTWGSFATPAGRVDYLMTKARLGEDGNDPERRLTKSLVPVREVMEAGDLDFNQLLQRDLDDHRVAVQLIPYLMTEQASGPAFFPPIVAVLLPFKSKRPSRFASLEVEATLITDDGADWLQQRAGDSFQVQRLANADGQPHRGSIGKLWWNSAEAQMVVLDGQHRAMALLAVERTITKSWQGSSGAKYRSFYEYQVQQLLDERGSDLDLSKVEVPVTVCWFPEHTGEHAKPHEAARKLFVDVNKEARPPSESRIILLSDAELKNILTRRLLSELRSHRSDLLPLYAVEYDNPQVNASRPARWSVLTSITVLKAIVERLLFGPARQLQDVATRQLPGRPNWREQDKFMRTQLDIETIFDSVIDDGGFTYQRDELGNVNFPLGQVETIAERFAATWGRAILTLLSHTTPYAAHARALTALKDSWHRDDSPLALAYDALFSGVGVFWTLRASHEDFLDKRADGLRPRKSDVIVAWESLDKREQVFESIRAKEYFASETQISIKRSKDAFAVFNTQACQIGQMLALGALWELRKQDGRVRLDELPDFASALVDAWNAFFAQEHGKGRDRKVSFNNAKSEITHPLNQINNMDTPQAVYFRYFWMQALDTPAAWEFLRTWFPDRRQFSEALCRARAFYLDLLVKQNLSALKTSKPGISLAKLEQDADEISHKALKRALRVWFFVDEGDYDHWAASLKVPSQRAQVEVLKAVDDTSALE